jgi:hypothetical protein
MSQGVSYVRLGHFDRAIRDALGRSNPNRTLRTSH